MRAAAIALVLMLGLAEAVGADPSRPRITFEQGSQAATVRGTVAADGVDYRLPATKGQSIRAVNASR